MMSWLSLPRDVADVKQLLTLVIRNQSGIQRRLDSIMALGKKTLDALDQLDAAIAEEFEEFAGWLRDNDSVDDETSNAILSRLSRVRNIVAEKTPDLDPEPAATDPAANPAPAVNPDVSVPAEEIRPVPSETGIDAPSNLDAPGSVGGDNSQA